MAKAKTISVFDGEYGFLSNFYHAPIEFEGIPYLNNEAAFQAQKVMSDADRQLFSDLNPSQAKRKGRRVYLRPDWEQVKDEVMYRVCKSKFEQHEDLRRRLIATGDAELIEGNTWGDRYWGVDGYGENKLGQILMRIRDELSGT